MALLSPLADAPLVAPVDALASALVEAQRAAVGVHKSSKNSFHRYDYASAETIIRAASTALTGAGLALVCVEADLVVVDDLKILRRRFTLYHASGQSIDLAQAWPIVVEKGRPLDKAVASADTAGLGYLLRSLLMLPRVEAGTDLDDPREGEGGAPTPRQVSPAQWVGSLAYTLDTSADRVEALLKGAGRDYRKIAPDKRSAAAKWVSAQLLVKK